MAKRRAASPWGLVERSIGSLVVVALLVYPCDWLLWKARSAAGAGLGSVPVTTTTAATLKGNHYEVYDQQVATVVCSHSLLPQAGAGACWWLRRHPSIIVQY